MTAGSWTSNEVGLDPQYVLIGESTCHSACLTQHWCVCGGGGGCLSEAIAGDCRGRG